MSMRLDTFKGALRGGGARANLFRVKGSFPNGASSAVATAAGALGGALGGAAGNAAGGVLNAVAGGGPARGLEFLCKAASLPGSTIGEIQVPFRGRQLKLPGDRTFENWTITILNDTDFAIRNAFETWSNAINSHVDNVGPEGLLSLQQTWEVEQLSRTGPSDAPQVLKSYRFEGCWPTVIAPIDVSADSTDTIEEFTVDLAYQYWTSDTTS